MNLLLFLARKSRGIVALSILTAAITGMGGVALIGVVHRELDRPTPGGRVLAWAFAGLCGLVAMSRFVAQASMARLGQGSVAALCKLLCRKVLSLPLERFEELDSGKVLAVLTEDIVLVANALTGIPQICVNLPLIVIGLGYVGWLSPATLAFGVVFAAGAVAAYLALVSPAMRRLHAARAGQDVLVGHFQTLVDGFRELRLHRARREGFLTRALGPAADTVRDRTIAGQTLFALAEGWGELAFFGFLGSLLFVLPMLHPIERSTMAGIVLVALYIMGPLDVILTWLPVLGRAQASMDRIQALIPSLDQGSGADATACQRRPAIRDEIRLEGVRYAYGGDTEDSGFSLGPIELDLRPGELVILAGGNGSGKTTLVKVLCGLYPAQAGTITLDGQVVGEAEIEAYRQLFTVLFADGHLFRDLYGLDRPGLEAEAEAGLRRFGLGGRVGFEGVSFSTTDLSQGQRGRLALLTALLEDRPVCILDEWAANQDPRFKRAYYREILPSLREAGKALLVISHDEEYYDVADRVVRLREGRLAADAGLNGDLRPAFAGGPNVEDQHRPGDPAPGEGDL